MATPQAVTAVIRASRPDFKSAADKAAFAVHAILSVNGFSLRKVGDGVDEAAAAGSASLPTEEADLAGWNAQAEAEGEGGTYSFLYLPEPGMERQHKGSSPPLLLVKCLRLEGEAEAGAGAGGEGVGGGLLLVSLADAATGRPPVTLELQLSRYVSSAAPGAGGYEHLQELIQRVTWGMEEALETADTAKPGAGKTAASTTAAAAATASGSGRSGGNAQQQQRAEEERERDREREREHERRDPLRHDPLRDDRFQPRMPARGPPGWGVGEEDLMPGGLPRPLGMGGGAGMGGVPLGPRGQGGGMHVGPENPIFADRMRHPRMGPPGTVGGPGGGSGVPGMRWDPISPEGLQGWNPDDFTRDGRAVRGEGFNDIGRPPPGRGPDWDNMFG